MVWSFAGVTKKIQTRLSFSAIYLRNFAELRLQTADSTHLCDLQPLALFVATDPSPPEFLELTQSRVHRRMHRRELLTFPHYTAATADRLFPERVKTGLVFKPGRSREYL